MKPSRAEYYFRRDEYKSLFPEVQSKPDIEKKEEDENSVKEELTFFAFLSKTLGLNTSRDKAPVNEKILA